MQQLIDELVEILARWHIVGILAVLQRERSCWNRPIERTPFRSHWFCRFRNSFMCGWYGQEVRPQSTYFLLVFHKPLSNIIELWYCGCIVYLMDGRWRCRCVHCVLCSVEFVSPEPLFIQILQVSLRPLSLSFFLLLLIFFLSLSFFLSCVWVWLLRVCVCVLSKIKEQIRPFRLESSNVLLVEFGFSLSLSLYPVFLKDVRKSYFVFYFLFMFWFIGERVQESGRGRGYGVDCIYL